VSQELKIAMVVPPFYELPPRGYGGIELVVAKLIDALVDRGHDVTLIGAGRNGTKARFRRTYADPQHERLGQPLPEAVHAAAAAEILQHLDVDLVHDHTLLGPLQARGRTVPTVATVHGPVQGEPGRYYRHLESTAHLVAISDAQRGFAPDLHWAGTVHNALDPEEFTLRRDKEDWVLFLGRCTPDKGMHLAIDAARAAGRPIKLAAKCSEPQEREYFAREIEPRLGPDVEWLGEIGGETKREVLAAARALVFPLQWEEPFGMVMIEALASGTPVVTMPRGAAPEIVTDGVTGFLRTELADLPAAIDEVDRIDPDRCRQEVLDRFTPQAMAAGYERVYRRVLSGVRARQSAGVALSAPSSNGALPRTHAGRAPKTVSGPQRASSLR